MCTHSYEDFEKVIMKISSDSACGSDRISVTLLKRLVKPVSKILHSIYMKSLLAGRFPSNLKHAMIVGIHKGGPKTIAKNYRPISLTSYLSKVLERIMRLDIVEYLNTNDLWDIRQHGSRAGRSTLSQLLEHQDKIIQAMENGSNLDVIYLDFEKAHDKVDHDVLL